jgi:extradiol dioxygenase family protein
MDPILHLSVPVRDVAEARAFYVDVLGCRPGRVRDGWLDPSAAAFDD